MLPKDPKTTLLKVLEIIEYPNDRTQYVHEFITVCKQQAVVNLVSNLPREKQDQLKEASATPDQKAVSELFNLFFSEEDYSQALEKATASVFKQFLEAIIPSLDKDQKDKLKRLLADLLPPSN